MSFETVSMARSHLRITAANLLRGKPSTAVFCRFCHAFLTISVAHPPATIKFDPLNEIRNMNVPSSPSRCFVTIIATPIRQVSLHHRPNCYHVSCPLPRT